VEEKKEEQKEEQKNNFEGFDPEFMEILGENGVNGLLETDKIRSNIAQSSQSIQQINLGTLINTVRNE